MTSTDTARTLMRSSYVIEDLLRAIGDESAAIDAGHPSRFRLDVLMRAYGILPYATEFVATVPERTDGATLIEMAAAWEADR